MINSVWYRRHFDALAVERQPHFAGTVDAVVGGVDPCDVFFELVVADLTAARLVIELVVVGRWGDQYTQLGKLCADPAQRTLSLQLQS